jgi:hypothetical protein
METLLVTLFSHSLLTLIAFDNSPRNLHRSFLFYAPWSIPNGQYYRLFLPLALIQPMFLPTEHKYVECRTTVRWLGRFVI